MKAYLVLATVFTVILLVVWQLSSPSQAQEGGCMPYDVALQKLAENGWKILPDIVLGDDYAVTRFLVASLNGEAVAAPVVEGCVLKVLPMSLGVVRNKGVPA